MRSHTATFMLRAHGFVASSLVSLLCVGPTPAQGLQPGHVFTMTNSADRNQLVMLQRTATGRLAVERRSDTGGQGIGSGLGSQGAIVVTSVDDPANPRRLYACNAGSDTISVFSIPQGGSPTLLQVVPSEGDMPVSITVSGALLYVLNAGAGSISGFTIDQDGLLHPLASSTRTLTTPVGRPAQVQFRPNGSALVITHKASDVLRPPVNIIDTFALEAGNTAGFAIPRESHGIEPFGFAFHGEEHLIVSEAFNAVAGASAVSSYLVSDTGELHLLSGSVANGQTAACWVVVTGDHAFVSNTGSGTISSYRIMANGEIVVSNAVAAGTGPNSQPTDMALGGDGHFLFVLLAGTGEIVAYENGGHGELAPIGRFAAVREAGGVSGLAAF